MTRPSKTGGATVARATTTFARLLAWYLPVIGTTALGAVAAKRRARLARSRARSVARVVASAVACSVSRSVARRLLRRGGRLVALDVGRAAAQAELARAGRPGRPAAGVVEDVAAADLLAAAGLVGAPRAADAAPGAQVELQPAVVAVAGVDRPVAAGLALGEPVPLAARGGRRRGAGVTEQEGGGHAAGEGGLRRGGRLGVTATGSEQGHSGSFPDACGVSCRVRTRRSPGAARCAFTPRPCCLWRRSGPVGRVGPPLPSRERSVAPGDGTRRASATTAPPRGSGEVWGCGAQHNGAVTARLQWGRPDAGPVASEHLRPTARACSDATEALSAGGCPCCAGPRRPGRRGRPSRPRPPCPRRAGRTASCCRPRRRP